VFLGVVLLRVAAIGAGEEQMSKASCRCMTWFLVIGLGMAAFAYFAVTLVWFPGTETSESFFSGSAVFLSLGLILIAVALKKRSATAFWGGIAILAPLLACWLDIMSSVLWIGSRTRVVVVQVVDASTQRPVPAASVRIYRTRDVDESRGNTNADGEVHVAHEFTSTGMASPLRFRNRGMIRLWDTTLAVDAAGYEAVEMSLEDCTGHRGWDIHIPGLPPVVVRLERKK
jgi:hypothetical protein